MKKIFVWDGKFFIDGVNKLSTIKRNFQEEELRVGSGPMMPWAFLWTKPDGTLIVGGGNKRRRKSSEALGQRSFLPLKVNASGVMPIIFAQALMFLPATVAQFAGAGGGNAAESGFCQASGGAGSQYFC